MTIMVTDAPEPTAVASLSRSNPLALTPRAPRTRSLGKNHAIAVVRRIGRSRTPTSGYGRRVHAPDVLARPHPVQRILAGDRILTPAPRANTHTCSNVAPAHLREATHLPADGELHWTPRGLAVALWAIALFTIAAVLTVLTQFLAVSDAPLGSDLTPTATHVAIVKAWGSPSR